MSFFIKVDSLLTKLINFTTIVLISSIILMTLVNIVLRQYNVNNVWIEPLNRHLVFIIIFLGAFMAIDNKQHLKIDALDNFLKAKKSFRALKILNLSLSFISIIVLATLLYAGVMFYNVELEYSVISFLGLKSHHLVSIIPFGFFLILLKSILMFFKEIGYQDWN